MIQTLFGSVEQEPTLLERLKSGVAKTRAGLVTRLEDTLGGKKEIDADLLDELEYTLVSADIGVRTSSEILAESGYMLVKATSRSEPPSCERDFCKRSKANRASAS